MNSYRTGIHSFRFNFSHSVVAAAFNQEKALVGAFSVITNLWMEFFEALVVTDDVVSGLEGGAWEAVRGGEPGGDVQDEDLDGQQD